jgi:hypothetical protein
MMTYNDYKQDLMDNYGSIDRKWKIDGNRLIRFNGEVEEYFYDLHHSPKQNIWGAFEEIRKFNLVHNKQVIYLNLWQRYVLMDLISLKKENISNLNMVKKKAEEVRKIIKKGYSRTMEGGKEVAEAIRNPHGVIEGILDRKRKNDKQEKRSSWVDSKSVEQMKEEYQLKLMEQLEIQKAKEELRKQEIRRQYEIIEKSDFEKKLEKLAERRLRQAINKDSLTKRRGRKKGER